MHEGKKKIDIKNFLFTRILHNKTHTKTVSFLFSQAHNVETPLSGRGNIKCNRLAFHAQKLNFKKKFP